MMKPRLLMIAAVSLLIGACNRQAPAPAAPKTDLDKFQGTWYLVMAMQDGKSLSEDKVKQTTIVFKGDTFRFPDSAEVRHEQGGNDQARRKRKHQRRWTPPRPRKKSCSASTHWMRAAIRYVSLRPASHVPPLWVPSPGSGYILQVWPRQKK